MNILLIAPDNVGLNTIPEIRALTSHHSTSVLSGNVILEDIQKEISRNKFDVIHFATHLKESKEFTDILLSNDTALNRDQVTQIVKKSKCRLVFFNLCSGARIGAYVSRNTNASTIYTTIELLDADAWTLPLDFYTECADHEKQNIPLNFKEIFNSVDDQSSTYNFSLSSKSADYALEPIVTQLSGVKEELSSLNATMIAVNTDIKQFKGQFNVLEQLVYDHSDRLSDEKLGKNSMKDTWLFYGVVVLTAISSIITITGTLR